MLGLLWQIWRDVDRCFSPRSSGKLVRYEIFGEESSLYEVLVWEAFPHVLCFVLLSRYVNIYDTMAPMSEPEKPFIASGGDPMANYTNIPIRLHVLSALLVKMPKVPGKKHIFVNETLSLL